MVNWPLVYIIVLNWNGWEDTTECLNSIYRITYPRYRVVVVDNFSSDDSVSFIRQWAKGKGLKVLNCERDIIQDKSLKTQNSEACDSKALIILQTGANLGYAGGNNVGIRYALKNNADYVLILNNDTIVNPNFLEPLVLSAEKEKIIGIIGGKILDYYKPDKIQTIGGGIYNPWQGRAKYITTPDMQVDYISGCLMLIKRTLLEDIGLFDESYFLYFEDTDLNFRAKAKGWKIAVNPESVIWHKHSKAIGGNISPLKDYYGTRNAFYLNLKFHKMHLPFALVIQGIKAIKRLFALRFRNFLYILKAYKDFFYHRKG